jgi:hypothetical protein
MIVRKEIRTETGKCGGRYMEDRPQYDVRIYCNRCGREKLRGTDSLGWYEADEESNRPTYAFPDTNDGEQVNICPECIETEEEIRVTSAHLQQYIQHSIWARGSKIGIALRTIHAEQVNLARDCVKAKELLSIFNPENKGSLLNKIDQAIKSARLKPEI